jgi:hypothetical protein
MSVKRTDIVRQFCDILEEEGWEPEKSAIEKIVNTSLKSKEGLRKMLSRHPKWDSETLRITMPIEPSDGRLDVPEKMDGFRLLLSEGIEKSPLDVFESVLTRGGALTSDDCNALQAKGYNGGKTGQKIGRAINAWATAHGVDQHKNYNWRFNELINGGSNTTDRVAIFSINPVDFLTASHGDFSSCHNLTREDDHCYTSGNLSYAMDGVTMVFFTVATGQPPDYPSKKIDRINYHFGSGLLIQGRLYTDTRDDIRAISRAMVCKVIADGLDTANLWTKHAKIDQSRIVSTGNHYPDYSKNPTACTMSTLSGAAIPDKIKIGHVAYCISCGEVQRDSNILDCCDTTDDYMLECENCHARIHEDEAIWVSDSCYCSDCVSYCNHCHAYHDTYEVQWVQSVLMSLCDYCLREDFTECAECGKTVHKDDSRCAHGDRYCKTCYNEQFSECEECGNPFENDELTEMDGRWVCRDCHLELVAHETCELATA